MGSHMYRHFPMQTSTLYSYSLERNWNLVIMQPQRLKKKKTPAVLSRPRHSEPMSDYSKRLFYCSTCISLKRRKKKIFISGLSTAVTTLNFHRLHIQSVRFIQMSVFLKCHRRIEACSVFSGWEWNHCVVEVLYDYFNTSDMLEVSGQLYTSGTRSI